jgi:hypothetical protein
MFLVIVSAFSFVYVFILEFTGHSSGKWYYAAFIAEAGGVISCSFVETMYQRFRFPENKNNCDLCLRIAAFISLVFGVGIHYYYETETNEHTSGWRTSDFLTLLCISICVLMTMKDVVEHI